MQVAVEPRVDDGHRPRVPHVRPLRVEARPGQGPGGPGDRQGQGRERDGVAASFACRRTARPASASRDRRRGRRPEWVGGAGGSNLPAARIDYVNTLKFDVDYTIEQMGPSGVQGRASVRPQEPGRLDAGRSDSRQADRPADKEQTIVAPVRGARGGDVRLLRHPRERRGQARRTIRASGDPADAARRGGHDPAVRSDHRRAGSPRRRSRAAGRDQLGGRPTRT